MLFEAEQRRRVVHQLEDVILGCAYPEAAQGNNIARIVGLLAGLPHAVPGMTVNRFCGSSRPTAASAPARRSKRAVLERL